ncbi:hypothetical protein N0V82_009954 [Gnomoniopsis sp. IMI 355080]|nr:hypothetical protein N0V82_009954 [Gnomoniopsis sp. IMI 355080]
MALPQIHAFYRFWFQWVDPLILIPTIYALLFTPQVMLDAFIPPPLSAYNPNQAFLFHQLAAMYAFVTIMLGVGLRVSKDINVWRVIIGGVWVVDIAMLASNYASLEQQGRLGALRSADWGNILFTALVTVIRSFFLAGVGVGKDRTRLKQL